MVGDTPRDVLTWIGAGDVIPADWSQERWHAFRSRCRDEFDFDPDEEKPLYMAERLGKREGKWSQLWDRFCEAPGAYHGVREMLEQAQPMDQMTFEGEPWPRINREREANLSVGLGKLEGLSPADARSQLAELEMAHKERREWVWAKTGEAPLALALKPLMRLADGTRVVPSFQTVAEYASWYDEIGAGVDAAALSSYRGIKEPPHRNAICGVIRALYLPWLEEVCRKFQEVVLKQGFEKPGPVEAQAGDCLLFVDGLRLDLGKDLIKVLERSGNEVSMSLRHSALPPITPTAKPVVSPVAPLLEGKFLPPDFQTQYDGKILTHDVFKKLLGQVSYPWIDLENITGPENEDSCGWCEAGKIDHYGHKLGEELPMQLPQQIGVVADAVSRLFDAGWRRVLVVTDHGWLLMPGNLPKYDLPGCVVEQRWSRTAVAKGESNPDVPKIPWHWNEAFHVLVPHGANAFKNTAYSHGGISPQECFIPVITVSPSSEQGGGARARISSVKWRGLRCVIQVEDGAGMTADVHDLKMSTSLVAGGAKTVEEDGEVSLLITDGDYVGSEVLVFVQDSAGTVQAKQNSTVGG